MDKVTSFLTVMSMLSTAASTMTDHLLKKRFWDTPLSDPSLEASRQMKIHGVCGLFGALLCLAAGLKPLTNLGSNSPALIQYLIVGILTSYGGSFFNETLDLLREFKLNAEKIRNKA